MDRPKVDGKSLKQAIEQFGSLREAIKELSRQRDNVKSQITTLTEELQTRKSEREKCSGELKRLKQSITEGNEVLDQILAKINGYIAQYRIFENFIK